MTQHFNPDRLEALRLAHGLSRSQFADKIGLSRQIVHAWLTGRRRPTVTKIEMVAKAFNLDSRYFFADTVHQIGEHDAA